MPTIQIRNIPQKLYDKLVKAAANSRRTVTQEAFILLEMALTKTELKKKAQKLMVLERLDQLKKDNVVDTDHIVQWVRTDRERYKE